MEKMKRRIILFLSIFFCLSPVCRAQDNINDFCYLDLSYSLTGLMNHGWGIGLSYERKLFDYISVKGNFGHMTFLTGIKDVYNTSVSISAFINYYPFGQGLDKLYISAGNGCDFMNYFGRGELPPEAKDTLIHVTPQIGWKFNVLKFLIIDLSAGYKLVVSNTKNYRDIKNYINSGLRFGLDFQILFGGIKKGNKHEENNYESGTD